MTETEVVDVVMEARVYRRVLRRLAAVSVLDADDRRLASMLMAIQDWGLLQRHGEHTVDEHDERYRAGIARLERELANE